MWISKKDSAYNKRMLADLESGEHYLKERLEKLSGHAVWCLLQVDPEWKPCTCGRG